MTPRINDGVFTMAGKAVLVDAELRKALKDDMGRKLEGH